MINKLLNKEFSLCVTGPSFIFLILAPLMMFIPNYPRYVPFFYITISVLYLFSYGVMNNDMLYTGVLPVKRSDIVKARFFTIGILELLEIIICVPFGILGNTIMPSGNQAGINSTVAFYGLQLIVYAVFNFTFLVSYYKKADKVGWTFIIATAVYFVLYFILELPVWMKTSFGTFITSMDSSSQIKQIPILVAGIVIWFAMFFVTFKICVKKFEKINL